MMPLIIKRETIYEITKAVISNEKRGFEVVAPIKKMRRHKKNWYYSRSNDDFKDFGGCEEGEFYIVKMRRREEA